MEQTHWTFGDVRAALQQQPGDAAWSTLMLAMETAYATTPDEVLDVWVPYVRGHVDRWEDKYRILPRAWLNCLARGEFGHPLYDLCRAILCDQHIGASGLKHLANAAMLNNVTILYIKHQRGDAEGFQKLFESQNLGNLHTLSISKSCVGNEGVDALVASGLGRTLVSLRLASCEVGDEGMIRASQGQLFDHVTHLWLGNNDITFAGLGAMDEYKPKHLKTLALNRNELTDMGAMMLATRPWIGTLRMLNLENTGLSLGLCRDLRHILETKHIPHLRC